MSLVRAFSTLYDIVGRNGQDESADGDTVAKESLVQTVQETSRDFKIPWQLQGRTGNITLSLTASSGPFAIVPTQTDIQHIARIWYVVNGQITDLVRIESEEKWLRLTDNDETDDPIYYRFFEMAETGTANTGQIIVWPGPSAAFISQATNLRMSYYAQLANPSADADIIRMPSEHEPLLINGGTFHMAEKQGDSVLMKMYAALYERDRKKLNAAITHMRLDEDLTIEPSEPYGRTPGFVDSTFTQDYGRR